MSNDASEIRPTKLDEVPLLPIVVISIVWTIGLLCFPIDTHRYRNPPPHDLVFQWWWRMAVANGVIILNGIIVLATGRQYPRSNQFLIACAWLLISSLISLSIQTDLFNFLWNSPYASGQTLAPILNWYAHLP